MNVCNENKGTHDKKNANLGKTFKCTKKKLGSSGKKKEGNL